MITLEKISPYLDHKLKFLRHRMDGDNEIYELACIEKQADSFDLGFYYDTYSTRLYKSKYDQEMEWMSDLVLGMRPAGTNPYMKPILHPLSDLTKPIKVEGYNEWKEFMPWLEIMTKEPLHYMDGEDINDWINGNLSHKISFAESMMIQKHLYRWHFAVNLDPDDYIDINTI